MKKAFILLLALILLAGCVPSFSEASPSDYIGQWYAESITGTSLFWPAADYLLELRRDRSASFTVGESSYALSWEYYNGSVTLTDDAGKTLE